MTGENDYSLEMLHRASVVAQTKISFSKKQLLQLIQEYLTKEGLRDSASCLQREANLTLMTSSLKSLVHSKTTGGGGAAVGTPSEKKAALVASKSLGATPKTPLRNGAASRPTGRGSPAAAGSSALQRANSHHNVNLNLGA